MMDLLQAIRAVQGRSSWRPSAWRTASPSRNKTAEEIAGTAQARGDCASLREHGMRDGRHHHRHFGQRGHRRHHRAEPRDPGRRSRIDPRRTRSSQGIHIMGGLTNIGQQLPPKAADGSDLKLALECAFLTLAVPLGIDAVLATPWRALSAAAGRQLRARRLQELPAADRQQRIASRSQIVQGLTEFFDFDAFSAANRPPPRIKSGQASRENAINDAVQTQRP